MDRIVQITLHDALGFPTGSISPASYTCVVFCRVPPDWLDVEGLKKERLETVFEHLYGKNWRMGNEDGSRYVVLSAEDRILTPEEEQAAPWRDLVNDRERHYWFYRVSSDGALQTAAPADL